MRMNHGLLATACVPWREDYSFDEAVFRAEVRHLLGAGLTNLYIFGTAGEGYAVTDAQYAQIGRVFYEEMQAGGGQPQIGVIGLSVPQVAERIRIGLEIGYRAFQISLPCWGAVNDREMYDFFDAILGGFPQAQFLHYNLSRGHRVLTAAHYGRITADHPNLVATKSSAPLLSLLELVQETPEICHFFTEFNFATASLYGPCGLLVSITAINPAKARALFEAGARRDAPTLVAQVTECRKIHAILFNALASGQHMDGAYDKLFVKLALPDFALRLLPPYQGTSDEEFAVFRDALRARVPGWI